MAGSWCNSCQGTRAACLPELWGGQGRIDRVAQQGAAHRRQLRANLVGAPGQQLNQALVRRRLRGAQLRRRLAAEPAAGRAGGCVGAPCTPVLPLQAPARCSDAVM